MKTDQKILNAAQEILDEGGFGAVSFDSIAKSLGISKQAVLYWFPSKQDLLAALLVSWLKAEANCAIKAIEGAQTEPEAIAAFVKTIAQFHAGNLNRFRMMYLAPQTVKSVAPEPIDKDVLDRIHQITRSMYSALTERLEGAPDDARKRAAAIHSAVLGIVLMVGLADGINDPLKHTSDDLIDALIRSMTTSP